jgi:hypothetical protein
VRLGGVNRALSVLVVVAGGALIGTALAAAVAPGVPPQRQPAPPPVEQPSKLALDKPLADGVRVGAGLAATPQLPFAPVMPASIGRPLSVFVRGSEDPSQRSLALVYQSPAYGRFVVLEESTALTEADLESLAATCHPETGCEGSWTMITLATGTRALQIASGVSNGVLWLHKDVQLDVYGPAATFTVADAQALANRFASAAP